VKNWWRAETGIFLGSWLLFMFAGRSGFLNDPGTFWNTATGAQVLATGRLPTTDSFSCTFGGQPWVPNGTLGAVILAILYRIGGLDTLVLATAVILAALCTWMAHRLIRVGFHWLFGVTLVFLFIIASQYHYHARPHLATMLLLAWTFVRLADYEAGRISFAGLLWLVPVLALWLNLHTGALGGLGTVSLAIAGWAAAWVVGLPSPVRSWRHVGQLALLGAACWLTLLVNPFGWRLPMSVLQLLRSEVVPRFILEHQPLKPFDSTGVWVLLLAVIYFLALVNTDLRQLRVTWLLPVVWFVLGLQRIRNAPLFAIINCFALAEVLPHTRMAAWLAGHGDLLYRPPQPAAVSERGHWQPFLVPVTLVLVALGLQAGAVPVPVLGHGWAQLDGEHWPVALQQQLQDYETQHPGAAVLNDMYFGGFLIFYTPGLRVFIDDRCELYGDDFLLPYAEEYTRSAGPASARIDTWARQYGCRLALVERQDPEAGGVAGLDHYLAEHPKQWRMIGETKTARLYKRID
jgi:hypothetical protein